jgi:hypothetical protein
VGKISEQWIICTVNDFKGETLSKMLGTGIDINLTSVMRKSQRIQHCSALQYLGGYIDYEYVLSHFQNHLHDIQVNC